ncbi:hypothetical protein za3_18 [Zamilon virus]|uniref:Uncharacterized protein n=1 Tax=Zamilon virus TaxID=1411887 RepID=A0A2P1EHJ3_9VIRU|nr:hypothetical protein za3_18 [Zamilon virus]
MKYFILLSYNYNKMKTIKHYENVALSNTDILDMLDNKAQIVLYPDLINYNSIDEVLGPYGACILLFEAKKNFGHWCCLFKRDDNTIEFFNSYGGYPDNSLKFIPLHFRKISNQYYPYLSLLLLECPYELHYNEFKFQKRANDIKTCGRWCVIRILLRHLSIYEFKNFIDEMCKYYKAKPDEIITMMTI